MIAATIYELIAHWELRPYTTPRFFKHLALHHMMLIIVSGVLKALEYWADAGTIPQAVVRVLWLAEGASGASDAWYVLCHTPLGVKLSMQWHLTDPQGACFVVQRFLRFAALIRTVLMLGTSELAAFAGIYGMGITHSFWGLGIAAQAAFEAYCISAQLCVLRTITGVPFA